MTLVFAIGTQVRYKPGFGTYGYEDILDTDGRIPGEVIGHTRTRIRIRMKTTRGVITRAVDAKSLEAQS